MPLLQQLMLKACRWQRMINVSAATVSASSLARSLGDGAATGHIHRPGLVGIRTVAKLANRVAARVGRSTWRRHLSDGAETLFQNYRCGGSGGHGGHGRLRGTRRPSGQSRRLRSRTLYRSIRRHTIYTRCLTTASRWGRLLWPLLAGRMRLYRMGLSLLCGCSRWLLTSRNTVSEAPWMATNGSSPSSRSSEWRPFRITVNQTDLSEVGGNPTADGSR
jgi:hypothetical protein